MSMMCGGTGAASPADSEVQALIEKVKPDVEAKVGENFAEYKAISVRMQLVAGMNYFVKVSVGGGKFIHLRIYVPLPGQGEPEVSSYKTGLADSDALEYFERQ